MHVFTEGRVTEPSYIEIIRDRGVPADPDVTVEVRIANATAADSRRTPMKLVDAAASLMRDEAREARRSGLATEYWPQVWCVFDRDQHESIETALRHARDADVRVAFSHPCFEVWRLLHHKSVTGSFGGVCNLAATRLPFAPEVANIKLVLPEQIPVGSYADTKRRALQMNAAHATHVPMTQRDPYTDVFTLVEQGLPIWDCVNTSTPSPWWHS
ncbi:RloB family protein [Dactylosporangium sp. NPDC000555]|uniref:RloB family protein n=1 Tax=Dactylosporangium sp. NPDC000555 TaxID=3154260 RepID=UPI00332868C5